MVAKTFQGLEEVLAEELRALGAENVEPGRRMVMFEGDLETMYKANLCCRTALRILKPIYKFIADSPDSLYEMVKEFDWEKVLSPEKTFAIDSTVNSEDFTHSRFVTYRVKDGIVDFFTDKYGEGVRPKVRLQDADILINVHISGNRVTLSLDSSGESLHKRGYRVAQTEAPINEVLAAGIILMSGYRGGTPFVDPMCGSGTFLIEAALIAANINPGIYRKEFAFETWPDFDQELFESLYNDDSQELKPEFRIYGADMSPKAIAIARENIKSAGVSEWIDLECKPLSQWNEAPEGGILITNPPYGERITTDDMDGLYKLIGTKLKNVFKGYHAWIIGYRKEYFDAIGLAPSTRTELLNGSLECELREYIIFEGDLKSYRRAGGVIHRDSSDEETFRKTRENKRRLSDDEWRAEARKGGFSGKKARGYNDREDDRRSKGSDRKRSERFSDMRGDRSEDKRDDRRYGFGSKRDDRQSGFGDRREDRRRGSGEDRKLRHDVKRAFESHSGEESENPLNRRRNVKALENITGKQPSIGGQKVMRSRGWKKKED